ncbi:MAG: DNA polymerase III subunit delta' [Thermobacillus sp. ZCTH02-B1]|uniref:DNA polymerase III subunit delta' n=1 Tax=Thermobacillus sp. ZCTH02-B1 TaxID=1858795 RepID=UPI000B56A65E|nr:DNA polymerase III subunit delta' [Thermobacillus sp. ZCTH02-B1]OUM93938.1 MAG: DNA polymerase III subunit delta' [Thermobacillus sp. ZCTH02-B1]
MRLSDITGQPKAVKLLKAALKTGSIHHAWLFGGPAGTGRKQAALAFAQALFCTAGGDDACGECPACRKVEHGNEPDLRIVEPDGAAIKIDQIRELQRDMSFRAPGSKRKVTIIERAETMTPQAANSMLKFLEEPSSPVVVILLTENPQAILPTIRSRVRFVPFLPLPPQVMLEKLLAEGQPPLLARAAVHLAAGIDACRAIIQQEGFAETRKLVIQLGKDSLGRLSAAMVGIGQAFKNGLSSDRIETALALLVLWYRDLLNVRIGRRDQVVFTDEIGWMDRHAFMREPHEWVACMEHTLEAGKRIRAHVSPQLALEQHLVRIQGG